MWMCWSEKWVFLNISELLNKIMMQPTNQSQNLNPLLWNITLLILLFVHHGEVRSTLNNSFKMVNPRNLFPVLQTINLPLDNIFWSHANIKPILFFIPIFAHVKELYFIFSILLEYGIIFVLKILKNIFCFHENLCT